MENVYRVAQMVLISSFVVLTGCQTGSVPATFESSAPAASGAKLGGKIMGGQQPVTGATIQLYYVGTTGNGSASTAMLNTTVTTNASGNFSILASYYTCPSASTLTYLVSTGGNPGLTVGTNNTALTLMVALGACGSLSSLPNLNVNEVTTVATIAALYPYMTSYSAVGSSSADSQLLTVAFSNVNEYANISSGTAPGTLASGVSYASATEINTLADAIAACVNSSGPSSSGCSNLFGYAATGSVAGVTSLSGGSGYSSAPTVTFSAPGGSGTTATGTANVSGGAVTGVTIVNAGSGYTSAPTVIFSAPTSGITATGTATMSGGAPTETVGALLNILNNPTANVTAICNLDGTIMPFQPTLSCGSGQPSYWSLPIIASPPSVPYVLPVTGNYIVTNTSSGLAWDNNSGANAADIYLHTATGTTAQEFTFTQLAGGLYSIHSVEAPTEFLNDNGNSIAAGGTIIQYNTASLGSNEVWNVAPISASASSSGLGGYIISSELSGLPIDANSNTSGYTAAADPTGHNLVQEASTNGGTTQVWTITPVGSGCQATTITPEIWTSIKGWQSLSSISVPSGVEVSLAGEPSSGGSWSWTGSNGFSSSALQNNNVPVSSGTNTYTATYTNSCGTQSTLAYTVTVGTGTLAQAPCDILNTDGVPCGAAYSLTRRMLAAYTGPLFQLSCASCTPTTMNIGTSSTTGEVAVSTATSYCSASPASCYISEIYDQISGANGSGSNNLIAGGSGVLYQTSPYNGLPLAQTPAPTPSANGVYTGAGNASPTTTSALTATGYFTSPASSNTGIPTGNSAITEYYVRSNYALVSTEGDFGDMDSTTVYPASNKYQRFALGYSAAAGTTAGSLAGAYYCVDPGNTTGTDYNLTCASSNGTTQALAIAPSNLPSPPLFTLIGKYSTSTGITIETADAIQGALTTIYGPTADANTPSFGGRISLGEGGDGKIAMSSFQEGAIIASTTTLAEDTAVQANIAAFYGQLANPLSASNYQGPGDIVPGATGWWGLRAYNNAFAAAGSNAVLLLNQTTGSTQAIAVTATGDLNVAAAQSFCANAVCSIETWYDQTGNGHNMTQANQYSQALLLFNCTNGAKVCAYFSYAVQNSAAGGDGYTSNATAVAPFTQNAVIEKTDSSIGGTVLSSYQNSSWAGIGGINNETLNANDSATGQATDTQPLHSYVFQSVTGVWNPTATSASSAVYLNGLSSTFSSGTNAAMTTSLNMGDNVATGNTNFMVGYIDESGLWPVSLTAAQAASLQANQRGYWQF